MKSSRRSWDKLVANNFVLKKHIWEQKLSLSTSIVFPGLKYFIFNTLYLTFCNLINECTSVVICN